MNDKEVIQNKNDIFWFRWMVGKCLYDESIGRDLYSIFACIKRGPQYGPLNIIYVWENDIDECLRVKALFYMNRMSKRSPQIYLLYGMCHTVLLKLKAQSFYNVIMCGIYPLVPLQKK